MVLPVMDYESDLVGVDGGKIKLAPNLFIPRHSDSWYQRTIRAITRLHLVGTRPISVEDHRLRRFRRCGVGILECKNIHFVDGLSAVEGNLQPIIKKVAGVGIREPPLQNRERVATGPLLKVSVDNKRPVATARGSVTMCLPTF